MFENGYEGDLPSPVIPSSLLEVQVKEKGGSCVFSLVMRILKLRQSGRSCYVDLSPNSCNLFTIRYKLKLEGRINNQISRVKK